MAKEVLLMGEGSGVYTKGYKDKEEAVKAMRKYCEREKKMDIIDWNDYYSFQPEEITMKSVVETRYTQHRFCGGETIGDPDNYCYGCEEYRDRFPSLLKGRLTFAFNANLR